VAVELHQVAGRITASISRWRMPPSHAALSLTRSTTSSGFCAPDIGMIIACLDASGRTGLQRPTRRVTVPPPLRAGWIRET